MITIKTLKLRTQRARKGKDRILQSLIADWKKLVESFLDTCVRHNVKSKAKLHALAYSASKSIIPDKKWHSKYRYTAMEVAVATYKSWTKLKKKGRARKRPELKKLFLKLYKESNGAGVYRIFKKGDAWFVRIATTPRNSVVLPLIVSDYEAKLLEGWSRGRITSSSSKDIFAIFFLFRDNSMTSTTGLIIISSSRTLILTAIPSFRPTLSAILLGMITT